ncbi:hypothetical protein QE152_g22700 [Popillia japonica]|uniref:Uncharacterized protein n=1 Tax=Popillia japonica TaxID=7064 RepID=A0AAW1KJL0_POPJA
MQKSGWYMIRQTLGFKFEVVIQSLVSWQEAQEKEREETGEDEDDLSFKELGNILLKINGCSKVSTEDAEEWMVYDSSDPGFQILSDDEFTESMREESVEEEDRRTCSQS